MDDWDFSGGDGLDFTDTGSGSDFVPDYSGSDYSGDTSASSGLFGGDTTDYSSGIPGIDSGSNNYSGYSGDSLGTTSVAGFDWTKLINPALGGLSAYAKYEGDKSSQAQKEKDAEKLYAFQLAEQEKYYQAHGAQLSAALGNYAQFQKPANTPGPFSGIANAPSPFMPAAQSQGLLSYGY